MSNQHPVADHAKRYLACGWAPIPIIPKEKRPRRLAWGKDPFRTAEEIDWHFQRYSTDNVGIIFGPKSGICDIEYDSDQGRQILDSLLRDDDKRTPSYTSRKSVHRLYRLPEHADNWGQTIGAVCKGNVASCEGIEIRLGLDGQVQSVAPPSVVYHTATKANVVYRWLDGLTPWETEVRPFPDIVLERVLERICIRDEGKPTAVERPRSAVTRLPNGDRVGDVFNAKATWHDVLEPAGWRITGHKGDLTLWLHPGSQSGAKHSAATGWVSQVGNELLQVYSTNTPFDIGMGSGAATYSKFEAYAVLYHNGDRTAAARDLAHKGYKPDQYNNDSPTWRMVDVSRIVEGTASCK